MTDTPSLPAVVQEELIPLRDAARLVPRSGGRKAHFSTLYRWAVVGMRGVKLESVLVGSVICTSEPALKRFFAAVTAAREGRTVPAAPAQGQPAGVGKALDLIGI